MDFTFPSMIDRNNVDEVRKTLKLFQKCLKVKYDSICKKLDDERIKEFIRQRCENYTDAKGKMITSFLDKYTASIVIDRVLLNSNQIGKETLVTDPAQIKQHTIHHFQECTGGKPTPKVIPPQWKQQYEPKSYIRDDIYDNLMDAPSYDEWIQVIQHLPKDKAAGPTQITNEMLQHLGEHAQKILWFFVSACLRLNDIPDAWREANIYPIPKPTPWGCQLTNTCPITLLDTTRKAMIRLLNNRLSKIMSEHHVLRGNQFAGLPGKSTFEPIRIIHEIVQDAKEKNKELWVLFQDLSKAYDRVDISMLSHAMARLKLPTTFISLITNIFTERKNHVFTAVGTTDLYDVVPV